MTRDSGFPGNRVHPELLAPAVQQQRLSWFPTNLQCPAGRLLERVGDVCCDWAARVAHEDQVAWVHDQVAVPKHAATLTNHDVGVACSEGSAVVSREEKMVAKAL